MKKIVSLIFAGTLIFASANAQILSEQNVQINMELQPILQLSMEGPEMIDFSFTDISSYISGIQRNGATILKVSSSVTFDLWAVGYSNGTAHVNAGRYAFDPVVSYGGGATVANQTNIIPLTALELHQYPQNPVLTSNSGVALTAATTGNLPSASDCSGFTMTANSDYSTAFYDLTADTSGTTSNNQIYVVPSGTSPYLSPTLNGSATAADKYIAGYRGTGAGCGVPAGTWLRNPFNATANSEIINAGAVAGNSTFANQDINLDQGGYYFVMDYRIVPGLPARFQAGHPRRAANLRSNSGTEILGQVANMPILGAANTWAASGVVTATAQPGAYSMYVKYILAEDQ